MINVRESRASSKFETATPKNLTVPLFFAFHSSTKHRADNFCVPKHLQYPHRWSSASSPTTILDCFAVNNNLVCIVVFASN